MDVDILLRLDEGGSDRPVAGCDSFRIAAAQRLPVDPEASHCRQRDVRGSRSTRLVEAWWEGTRFRYGDQLPVDEFSEPELA